MLKVAMFTVAGLVAGGAIGYVAGTRSDRAAPATSALNAQPGGVCASTDQDNLLFSGFAIDGKQFSFRDLPVDLRGEALAGIEAGMERRANPYEEAAVRYALGREKGSADPFPNLDDLIGDQLKVTDEEVKEYFEQNRAAFPKDLSLAQLGGTIRTSLANQRKHRVLQEQKSKLVAMGFHIKGGRLCVDTGIGELAKSLPAIGGEQANADLVWVTQPFCPECRRLWPIVEQAAQHARISLVVAGRTDDQFARDLNAGLLCAGRQGPAGLAAWMREAHALPYQERQNLGAVRKAVREGLAAKANLDVSAYDACLQDDATTAAVHRTLEFINSQNLTVPPQILIGGMRPLGEQPMSILGMFKDAPKS